MKTSWSAIALTLAACAAPFCATHGATKAIVGATVVNIDGGAPIENAVVVIDGERIVAIGPVSRQALRPATIESATMLRAQKDIGSLEAGKYADILAVNADPLKNISALRNIVMIMKGGAIYRNDSADSIASGP